MRAWKLRPALSGCLLHQRTGNLQRRTAILEDGTGLVLQWQGSDLACRLRKRHGGVLPHIDKTVQAALARGERQYLPQGDGARITREFRQALADGVVQR